MSVSTAPSGLAGPGDISTEIGLSLRALGLLTYIHILARQRSTVMIDDVLERLQFVESTHTVRNAIQELRDAHYIGLAGPDNLGAISILKHEPS